MNFLANLKQAWSARSEARAPQNLTELGGCLHDLCLQGQVESKWSEICRCWADRVRLAYHDNETELQNSRGRLGQLWLEQADIYLDIVEHLEGAASLLQRGQWKSLLPLTRSFQTLVEELSASIEAMQEWRTSPQARCLSCAWEGRGLCPHCGVRPLKPVRQLSGRSNAYTPLAGPQFQLFQTLQAVLAGITDVEHIASHLPTLQRHYQSCRADLERVSDTLEADSLAPILDEILLGLEQIEATRRNLDAQNIEEGWFRFFQAEQTLSRTLPTLVSTGLPQAETGSEDVLVWSNED